jgi:uracil-DNA glycosylase
MSQWTSQAGLWDRLPKDYKQGLLTLHPEEYYTTALEKAQKEINNSLMVGRAVYPLPEDVYAALTACPLDKVRVVILGQDPYVERGQAHGLSFSVLDGHPPPSLRNIFKRIAADTQTESTNYHTGDLRSWARQGILLLNTVLTVEEGMPNSHRNQKGWPVLTSAILKLLSDRSHRRLIFMLWGRQAQIFAKNAIDATRHVALQASHPSPLGANSAAPVAFNACTHFSQCNAELGDTAIVW